MTNHDLCKKLRRLNKLQVKWACQMKKLDLIIWTCAFLIGWYYLTELSTAYYRAITAYYDVKHSQAAYVLYGK